MPRYAKETTVPIERSRAEIEETLRRYGASEFHSGWKAAAAMIAFRLSTKASGALFIRFILPLPGRDERRFTHKQDRWGQTSKRSDIQAAKEWDQEIRQRWRALLLVIKAKLEAVECGISSVEAEFLAHIVVGNDQTLGDWIMDQGRLQLFVSGTAPQLGYNPAAGGNVEDAEFTEKTIPNLT